MKRLTLFLLFAFPTIVPGQYRYNFLKEHFFGRLPSARAEAMGKGYASIDGDLATAFFNPAGIATMKGVELYGSFASPFYLTDKSKYSYTSIGFKIKDYLIIGVNRNHFSFGEEVYGFDLTGTEFGPYDPYETSYGLTISSQPVKNFLFGLNVNYFEWNPLDIKSSTVYFDFGVIKIFQFLKKETSEHSVNIGASIVDLNNAKITTEFAGEKHTSNLPVITRFAANYQYHLSKHLFIDTLQTLRFLIQGEYQNELNIKDESAIRTGGELMFLEILSFRVGYYHETVFDYNHTETNFDHISDFTYGFGVQIPLSKLTLVPLNINFDYTSLPQPPYTNDSDFGNFTTYSFRLNWIFKDKK